MHDGIDNIFGRLDDNGNVILLHVSDGSAVTQIPGNLADNAYPVGSDLSVRYEHPEGIVLTREDADRLGIEVEVE